LKNLRGFLPLALCAVSGIASAQVTFSNVVAPYTLNPGSVTTNWIVNQNGPAGTIDFSGGAPAFKVGDSTPYSTGTSSINYDVTSTAPISSITWTMQGDVEDFGRVQYVLSASNGSGSLGSNSGSILGVSYNGGVNGAFTRVLTLTLSQAVTSFHVTTTLNSDINNQGLPSTSVALVGLVENNMNPVPEPATLAALGLGAIALIKRRRK
jgi:hypothetical protein